MGIWVINFDFGVLDRTGHQFGYIHRHRECDWESHGWR